MNRPHVYDKAEYHHATIEEYELPEEHADNHTVVFLRWLIEHRMMSEEWKAAFSSVMPKILGGEIPIHESYSDWDCCLIDDMLSDEGNAFAMHYFDFDRGKYLEDYRTNLQGSLPSEFHIAYSEQNYQKMRQIIDRRYDEWKNTPVKPPKKKWWPF